MSESAQLTPPKTPRASSERATEDLNQLRLSDVPEFPQDPSTANKIASQLVRLFSPPHFATADLANYSYDRHFRNPVLRNPSNPRESQLFTIFGIVKTPKEWPHGMVLGKTNQDFGKVVNANALINLFPTPGSMNTWNSYLEQIDKLENLHPSYKSNNLQLSPSTYKHRNNLTSISVAHQLVVTEPTDIDYTVLQSHDPFGNVGRVKDKKLYMKPMDVMVAKIREDGRVQRVGKLSDPTNLDNCFGIFNIYVEFWTSASGKKYGTSLMTNELLLLYRDVPNDIFSLRDTSPPATFGSSMSFDNIHVDLF